MGRMRAMKSQSTWIQLLVLSIIMFVLAALVLAIGSGLLVLMRWLDNYWQNSSTRNLSERGRGTVALFSSLSIVYLIVLAVVKWRSMRKARATTLQNAHKPSN